MGDLFRIHCRILGKIPGQKLIPVDAGNDSVEVFFVNVIEIIVNDVFYRQGKTFENIQILGKGKPPDLKRMT